MRKAPEEELLEDDRFDSWGMLHEFHLSSDVTLLKFNSEFTPNKVPKPNRKEVVFQPSFLRGELLVSGSVCLFVFLHLCVCVELAKGQKAIGDKQMGPCGKGSITQKNTTFFMMFTTKTYQHLSIHIIYYAPLKFDSSTARPCKKRRIPKRKVFIPLA